MTRLLPILLASAAFATPAAAQTATTPEDIAALRAQIEALQAKVGELEAAQAATAAKVEAAPGPAAKISWKGAPVIEGDGWSFKPRGRLQYDVGYVGHPDGYENPGLGFGNEVRRARLGVEGKLPGKFGYKFELDFASGDVEFADAILTYSPGRWKLTAGQHNTFQSLEELTSSLNTSFIERAAFTDAFNFERRVGVSAQWKRNAILAQAGVFTDSIADLNSVGDDNNSHSFDTRLVFMPKMGGNQLHFAGSFHQRYLKDAANSVRYRQRPAIHTTDVRFIDTGSIAGARRETGYGLEAAGIFGPFYVASEAFWQRVGRDGFPNPTFFGAYADAGYFFTGETRGYKDGTFDRVKVKSPVGKGGWGSLGANVRWDYLNLNDAGILGGKQNAFQLSLNWKPIDYVLFGLNAAHILYDEAAIALPNGDRNYSVNVIGLRSQVDF
ncbi:MAG: OprO/OprP family phosphate-selective porin [Sphingomicrobium sp.]